MAENEIPSRGNTEVNPQSLQAWMVHRALLLAEVQDPSLKSNPFWTILRQASFERFAAEFGGGQ